MSSLQIPALGTVAFLQTARECPVVTRHRLEGRVGNPLLQDFKVDHPCQRIAAFDAVIQKSKRFPLAVRFQPESDPAQLHRERILVHAVDAMRDHVTHRLTNAFRCGLLLATAHASQLPPKAPCRGEQEVSRAAGGIADFDREQGMFLKRTGE